MTTPPTCGSPCVSIGLLRTSTFPTRSNPLYFATHITCKTSPPSWSYLGGGGFNKLTIGSIKREFEQLIDASLSENSTLDKCQGSSVPIRFYCEEFLTGSPNSSTPFPVRARMANFDIRRILVDQESSVDIMLFQLFISLQLDKTHFTPYVGSDMYCFNDATTKTRGYGELLVTFGAAETVRSVKV